MTSILVKLQARRKPVRQLGVGSAHALNYSTFCFSHVHFAATTQYTIDRYQEQIIERKTISNTRLRLVVDRVAKI